MANGKIRFGKQSGGELALVIPDGVSNTEVVVPESGELATKEYVDVLKTIASGTATFDAVTNNINLTGIGVGVESGDVIQISGATDSKNNSEFTVEVITDDNNIIVNQAHANKGTSKNVANRSGDADVTVKLLAKWYNAPIGLGQAFVNVNRASSTNYTNNINRTIKLSISIGSTAAVSGTLFVNGLAIDEQYYNYGYGNRMKLSTEIPKNSMYSYLANGTGLAISVNELR